MPEWIKVEKLVANLRDKKEYVLHIRNLKQALDHRLVLKKVHGVIKFNEKNFKKMNLRKTFSSWWIIFISSCEETWRYKPCENWKEETIWCQN